MSFLNGIGSFLSNPFAATAAGGAVASPAMLLSTAGAFSGLLDTASQWYWNDKNYQAERDVQQYNQRLQALTYSREDNSIQRRVADLRAAGLSPVLAAGQGAGTGATVSITPARREATTISDKLALVANLLKMGADVSKTYAENKLIGLQTQKVPLELANMQEELQYRHAQINKTVADEVKSKMETYKAAKEAALINEKTRQAKFEADVTRDTNTEGSSPLGRIFRDLTGTKQGFKHVSGDRPIGGGIYLNEDQIRKALEESKWRSK